MRSFIKNIRRFFYTTIAKFSIGSVGGPIFVNGRTKFTKTTHLGKNTHFNGMEITGEGSVRIGDNFHSGPGCLLISSFHNYDSGNAIPYDSTYINKDIRIEDNVWLGSRVIVLGGVTIGEGAIIQAGSVVVRSIPPFSVAGGNPAKSFKTRNIENYTALKQKKQFH